MTPDQIKRLRAKSMMIASTQRGGRKGGIIRAMRAAMASETERKPPTLPRVLWLERPDP
jgi:hypothetical protein